MWFDNFLSSIMAWFLIQAITYPKTALVFALVGFALYCWTIDYIGYLFIRRKSEALQAEIDAKGTNVPKDNKNTSEGLYGGQESDE